MASPNKKTKLWILAGITGSAPAELKLENGILSLVILKRGALFFWHLNSLQRRMGIPDLKKRLKTKKRVQLFKVPLSKVSVEYPWYYFGGGCCLVVDKRKYRISFMEPQNTIAQDRYNTAVVSDAMANIGEGLDVGDEWRDIFEQSK